jgi:subtilisin family serine protease
MGANGFRRSGRLSPALILVVLALLISGLPASATPGGGQAANPSSFDGQPVAGTLPPPSGSAPPPPPRQADGRLDSALASVAAEAGRSRARGLERARAAGIRTHENRVQALLTVEPARLGAVRRAVQQAGGEVTGSGNRDRYVQVLLPPEALTEVAEQAGVLSVARPQTVEVAAGSQMTQGDAALNGSAWRSAGVVGTGVKVGIIDVGFKGYKSLLGSDLPASVTVKNFVDGQSDSAVDGTTEHGTACAEIVHDVAPGAQLYLAKVGTTIDIEEAATWMKGQGVRIISSSIGTYNVSPGDGTGYLENVVATARAAGITWFTAASNDREAHWGGPANIGAGGYHFFDSAGAQSVNFFGPGNGTAYAISPGHTFQVHLRWSDWTSVNQDYDIHLWRWNDSTKAWQSISQIGGLDDQSGKAGQRPVETATATTSGGAAMYGWSIHRYSGSRAVNLEAFVPKFVRPDKIVRARSLSNLADAASAVTVAAVDVSSFVQESYSSEGPTNGPGGVENGGLAKPDISAYANVNTVSYGSTSGLRFNGTSAATPHVAGAAALVRQANPSFTPAQLQGFLTNRARDLGAPGPDTAYGHGRVYLGAPVAASDTTPPAVSAPNTNFRTNVVVAQTSKPVKLRVNWTASDPGGISATQLQQKVNSNAFKTVALSSANAVSKDLSVPTSSTTTRRFRARATDPAGNTSAYATGPTFKVRVFQNGAKAILQSGSWKTASNTKYYGGSARHTNVAGRRQTLTRTMQDVAIVAIKGPSKGIAKVFVDGKEVASVDLYSSTNQYRQVVWAMDFGSAATHTVELRVTGTRNPASTGARVDFDAFLVMTP